jgi:hypothetical protein
MSDKLRVRRGISTNRLNELPDPGEILFDMDTRKMYVGDGVTAGGLSIAGGAATSSITELVDVSLAGITNGQTLLWNASAGQLQPGNVSGFSGSYLDLTNKPTIPSTLDSLTDVVTTSVTDGQVLTYHAATNNWIPMAGGISSVPNTFSNFSDGTTTVTPVLNQDTLKIEGGANIITVANVSNKTITVDYTGPTNISQLSDVTVATPAVGNVLRHNGSKWFNVHLSYNDLDDLPILGTAASMSSSAFATAAQGTLASSALQNLNSTSILTLQDVPDTWGTAGQILTVNGTGNGISFVTNNAWKTIQADTGLATTSAVNDTFTIAGANGISTSITGKTLTISSADETVTTNTVYASSTAVFISYPSTVEGSFVTYVYKSANGLRAGQMYIACDGNNINVADVGSTVGSGGISFDGAVVAGNAQISYTESNGVNGTIAWTIKSLNV